MSTEEHQEIVAAALRLAASEPWDKIKLAQIAAAAGITLTTLAGSFASKAEILHAFMRQTDQALLASLENDPVEGDDHDRLFDVLLRRIELLKPHKAAIASIMRMPADAPSEWTAFIGAALDSQGWMLTAAGRDVGGLRGDIHRLALARIFAKVLRVWLDDSDDGMARTMAALDRQLRDTEGWARRIETPVAILAGFAKAWRNRRTPSPEPRNDDKTYASAD